MRRSNAEVLNRTKLVPISDSLDRATILCSPGLVNTLHKPRGGRYETRAPTDLGHQSQTAIAITQTRKHVRVQLGAKAAVLRVRVRIQERVVPGQKSVAF